MSDSITSHILSPDTQAILLLCGSLGQPRSSESPLTPREYQQLVQWLTRQQLQLADLLQPEGRHRLETDVAPLPLTERILTLLNRGAALALAVEGWTNKGLWVISCRDGRYPQRLLQRLGRLAPPLLYGVGNPELLTGGGLAIVGSRDVDPSGVAFTHAIATCCAQQGLPVVSGGARGVDTTAMESALAAGGTVVGVLADSLARAAVAGKYRPHLRSGRLTLISPYDPSAGFNVGNAMSRNKQIYALSDFALVVSATRESGGTWSGAVENLKHGWVPLFVRRAPDAAGNQELLRQGAVAVDSAILNGSSVEDWLNGHSQPAITILPLDVAERTRDSSEPLPGMESVYRPTPHYAASVLREGQVCATDAPPATASATMHDLFPLIWPHLERALVTTRTDRELAMLFDLELKQVQSWLRRAVEQGLVQKFSKPTRYIATAHSSQTLSMFAAEE